MTLGAVATLLRIEQGCARGSDFDHTDELLALGAIVHRRQRFGSRYAITDLGLALLAETRARAARFDAVLTRAARQRVEQQAVAA